MTPITMLLITLCTVNLVLLFIVFDQVASIKKMQGDQNVNLIKLIYHKSVEVEDYEMADKIKKTMGKEFEFNKFN